MSQLGIQTMGAFTPVGWHVGSTIGSLRTGLRRMRETAFFSPDGQPIIAATTELSLAGQPLVTGAVELDRFLVMGAFALRECAHGRETSDVPLLLCVPEPESFDAPWPSVPHALAQYAHVPVALSQSAVFPLGRASIVSALQHAQSLFAQGKARACIVGGIDSFVLRGRIAQLIRDERLRYANNRQGLIPGEAAVFLWVEPRVTRSSWACIRGLGSSQEPRTRSVAEPNNGVELARAMKAALSDAGLSMADVGFFAHDSAGERFSFKEVALAMTRLRPKRVDRWTASTIVGEVGAAIGPLTLGYIAHMFGGGGHPAAAALYASASDGPTRGAVVITKNPAGDLGHG